MARNRLRRVESSEDMEWIAYRSAVLGASASLRGLFARTAFGEFERKGDVSVATAMIGVKCKGKLGPFRGQHSGCPIRKVAPLAGFALSLLRLGALTLLQTSVNVRPKLLQPIPEGVDAHLHVPVGKTR